MIASSTSLSILSGRDITSSTMRHGFSLCFICKNRIMWLPGAGSLQDGRRQRSHAKVQFPHQASIILISLSTSIDVDHRPSLGYRSVFQSTPRVQSIPARGLEVSAKLWLVTNAVHERTRNKPAPYQSTSPQGLKLLLSDSSNHLRHSNDLPCLL